MVRGLGPTAGTDLRVAVRAQGVVLLRFRFERLRLPPRPASHLRVLLHVALKRVLKLIILLSFSPPTHLSTHFLQFPRSKKKNRKIRFRSYYHFPEASLHRDSSRCIVSVTSFPRPRRVVYFRDERVSKQDTSTEGSRLTFIREIVSCFHLSRDIHVYGVCARV